MTKFKWTQGSVRSLVMIGDSNPHGPKYPLNRQNIDWRLECDTLKTEAIRVYAEVISAKKEVVLLDRVTGDMFTGQEACDLIGYYYYYYYYYYYLLLIF